jgi:glycosyltransferase involved in cell wall biosynthesis
MILGKKLVVVLPAYKAGQTLRRTIASIPTEIVDEILLVDDASPDNTVAVAKELGLRVIVHEKNLGYGGNQKTCYREALKLGADIVVMVHPDYQYDPRLVGALASMIASGVYDVVLASRILGKTARAGGMPMHKYLANRLLTLTQNICMGAKLSEYHTGYRAFSATALKSLPLLANSNNFVFDNQMLTQAIASDLSIGEISCPTRYFPEASSINLSDSIVYGLGVLRNCVLYRLWKLGLAKPRILQFGYKYKFSLED